MKRTAFDHPKIKRVARLHDWPEHAEDSVHKTLARRLELFANGQRPS